MLSLRYVKDCKTGTSKDRPNKKPHYQSIEKMALIQKNKNSVNNDRTLW